MISKPVACILHIIVDTAISALVAASSHSCVSINYNQCVIRVICQIATSGEGNTEYLVCHKSDPQESLRNATRQDLIHRLSMSVHVEYHSAPEVNPGEPSSNNRGGGSIPLPPL